MATDLVLDEILKTLSASQIDELRFYNRYLNYYIGKSRVNFPTDVQAKCSISTIGNGYLKLTVKCRTVEVLKEDAMRYLSNIKPTSLTIDSDVGSYLDPRWVRKVEEVYVCAKNPKNPVNLNSMVKNLTSCSRMESLGARIEVDEILLLEAMPHVEVLHLRNVKTGTDFWTNLTEKTKTGPGLSELLIEILTAPPVNADQFLSFLHNASFKSSFDEDGIGPANLTIEKISGTKADFIEKLQKMEDVDHIEDMRVANDFYLIISSVVIHLFITKFEG